MEKIRVRLILIGVIFYEGDGQTGHYKSSIKLPKYYSLNQEINIKCLNDQIFFQFNDDIVQKDKDLDLSKQSFKSKFVCLLCY